MIVHCLHSADDYHKMTIPEDFVMETDLSRCAKTAPVQFYTYPSSRAVTVITVFFFILPLQRRVQQIRPTKQCCYVWQEKFGRRARGKKCLV